MDTHWQLPLVLRLEWRITALGMNAALAGLLVMLARRSGCWGWTASGCSGPSQRA
jgi:hypothetical protein